MSAKQDHTRNTPQGKNTHRSSAVNNVVHVEVAMGDVHIVKYVHRFQDFLEQSTAFSFRIRVQTSNVIGQQNGLTARIFLDAKIGWRFVENASAVSFSSEQ